MRTFGIGFGLSLSAMMAAGGTPPPAPSPLTASSGVMMAQRNGITQAQRYEAPQLSNWMRSGSARQAGAMMIDHCIADDMAIDNAAYRPTVILGGTGTSVTAGGIFTWYYQSGANASDKRTIALYCRTNEMASAGDAAMVAVSPQIRDAEPFTLFMQWSATEMSLAVAYADGTVSTGTPVALPASFVGRASPGVFSLGGATVTTASSATFARAAYGRFAYLRGRLPTTTEMQRVARGESPAVVFAGELDRYYPLAGPANLAPAVGTGDLILRDYGTASGYAVRRCGTLCGASNGSVGFTVKQPLWGDGWAIDLENVAAGAPVSLSVTNTIGAGTTFEARAVLYSDGQTVLKDWTTMTGGTLAAGATAVLTLPGVAWSPLMQIEVRRTDTPALTWATHPVGVGPDLVDDGQSQQQIWGSYRTSDSAVLAAVTITAPCVSICWPQVTNGPALPYNHRFIDTSIDAPIGPAAFAKRWAELTGNKWARIRSIAVEGSGRSEYTANNALPKTVNTGPYRYWGTVGAAGSGIIADMLLRCGPRISAIIGHYSVDDLQSAAPFSDYADAYFKGSGSPSRSWAQIVNPIGLKVWLCEHDRLKRTAGSTTIDSYYTQVRNYVTANPSFTRLAPGFTLDKRMGTSADEAHQTADFLTGNARMGVRYATWLAGVLGMSGGMVNAGTLSAVTSVSPFTAATCTFSLPGGASLLTSDGAGQAFGFEVSVNNGAWTRVPPANAALSGNTVVVSGITGAASAADIRLRLNYDHVWGASGDAAVRFAEDNLTIEKLLLASVAGAPAYALGVPLRPTVGSVTAT